MSTLSQEQVNEIFFEEFIEVDGVEYTTVEQGEFEQDGKYQTAQIVFTDGTKFYAGYVTRSGSPFSEWHYDDWGDGSFEVEQREVVVTKWVAK